MSMIITEFIEVKICHNNYRHYENMGYTIKKEFDSKNRLTVPDQYLNVKWSDIPHGSGQKIQLKCDICGKKFERKINQYYNSHKNNDIDACSKKCQSQKSSITKISKYGTVNPAKICQILNTNYGRPKKHTLDSIKELCCQKGYVLIDDELIHNKYFALKDRVNLCCKNHNISFNISIASLEKIESINCPQCIKEKESKLKTESSIDEVRKLCEEKDYELLTNSIDNCDSKVLYICNKHRDYGVQSTSLYGLRHAINNCRMCWMPKQENHWNWNGGIASERDYVKHTPAYKKWVHDVFERDDYTCQCCGLKGVYLEAHHIYNFADYPNLRTELSNGITLCHNCHSITVPGSFHSVYTQFHNTPEQLNEYINKYQNNHDVLLDNNDQNMKEGF